MCHTFPSSTLVLPGTHVVASSTAD
jgi:hypothetical protein